LNPRLTAPQAAAGGRPGKAGDVKRAKSPPYADGRVTQGAEKVACHRVSTIYPGWSTRPAEHARFGLVQSPATVALEPMVVTARVPEVGCGGQPTLGVIEFVILICCVSRSAAADHDAVPIADLQGTAQRSAGRTTGGIGAVRVRTAGIAVESAGQVGDHASPATQCRRVGGQSAQDGGGRPATRRWLCSRRSGWACRRIGRGLFHSGSAAHARR
jgi:hypothetical protein